VPSIQTKLSANSTSNKMWVKALASGDGRCQAKIDAQSSKGPNRKQIGESRGIPESSENGMQSMRILIARDEPTDQALQYGHRCHSMSVVGSGEARYLPFSGGGRN